MTINDKASIIPTTIHWYTAPVGTDAPDFEETICAAIPQQIPSAWEDLGHTSLESPFEQEFEGGESSTKGSVQNPSYKISYTDRTTAVKTKVQQFDADRLKLYIGANEEKSGRWHYAQTKLVPVERALLCVFEDGDGAFGFHSHKGTIGPDAGLNVANLEDIVEAALRFDALMMTGKPGVFGICEYVEKKTTTP